MAQAKRSSGSGSSSSSGTRKSAAKKSSGSSRSGSTTRKTTSAKKSSAAKKTTSASSGSAGADTGAVDPRLEAIAQRVRHLNERIIEAGKNAGEGALTSYEKALKMFAGTLERGPGSSDVEWISNLATAQAKFIRDVTQAWTKAARDMLK